MFDVSLAGALLAGLLSFISPCVLPIVPPYLAYIAGVSFSDLTSADQKTGFRSQIFFCSLAFVMGFSVVFVALGSTATFIGKSIAEYSGILSVIAGTAILIMGLHFIGIFKIGLLYTEARFQTHQVKGGLLGAFVMGLAFAFGWTPCVGPVLAAILFVAGGEESVGRGASLLAAYSMGIGLPFIIAGLFAAKFIHWANRFKAHMRKIEIALGSMLVATGILFITGMMPVIANWMLETMPFFATIG